MEKIIGSILAVLIVAAILAIIMALPTMLLWNWIVPDLTKGAVTTLTFWKALGLNFLTAILFKPSNGSKSSK